MPPKHFYTVRWTQPYSFGVNMAEADALMDELIELAIELNGTVEADAELKRIMEL